MLPTVPIVLVLGALAGFSKATTYAQFCNDNACSDSCGESVSVDNPGCLNGKDRHSILFHGEKSQQVALIWLPTPDCPCQNECQIVVGIGYNDFCKSLDGDVSAQSFRFIGDDGKSGCPNNNY